MQLYRLKLVNFRQHAETEIAFGTGITAVVGPNGSGKTTLLEAIAWAFYGNPAARGSRDSIRRFQAPARSQVRVEVDFGLGAHEFRIVRGLYNAELFQDNQPAPIANSQQEVSSRVTRLLGMTLDEFFSTYFTGQKELAVMASMGPSDRARFLSRILGYEKLKRAQDKLRETRAQKRAELSGLEQGLGDESELRHELKQAELRVKESQKHVQEAEEVKRAATKSLETVGPDWTRLVKLRESVLSLESERRLAERDVGEARREFERLDRELAEALRAQSRLEQLSDDLTRVEPLNKELEELDRAAQAAGRRRSLSGTIAEVCEQRERVGSQLDSIGDPATELVAVKQRLEGARQELKEAEGQEERVRTAWIRDKQDAETRRLALRDQYREVQERREGIVVAGQEGQCPTCARPLGSEYEKVLESLDRQLEEIEIDGKYFAQRVTQLEREPEELLEPRRLASESSRQVEQMVHEAARAEDKERECTKLQAEELRLQTRREEIEREISELPEAYDSERHEAVRKELRGLGPVVKEGVQLQVKANNAEGLVGEAEAAEKTLSDIEKKHQQLKDAIADLGFREEEYLEARKRYEEAQATERSAQLELASLKGDLRAAEGALEQTQRLLREREERMLRITAIKQDLKLHDELDRALHDLRLELNAAMRPEIAERASSFLSDLTDGRYNELELDEQYRIVVVEDGIPKTVISGGEEDLVNLVLRLAISEMVAERAGQPLSLLVLDEIFGGLDEHRRHHVVELLRRLGGRFPQVVLITHIETVKDGVDRVLRVGYDESRSLAQVTEDEGVPAL